MAKFFIMTGAIMSFLGVGFGAFGAHAIRSRVSEQMLAVWNTGVQYHMFHALGLILIGLISQFMTESSWLKWSGFSLLIGIFLFSGSLYLLVLLDIRKFGMITPLGGVSFMIGWLCLFIAMLK